jgi:hypothetical protein
MSADDPGVTGLTQRDLLMEIREDIKGLRATVDAIARDQALEVERRASMQRSADSIAPSATSSIRPSGDVADPPVPFGIGVVRVDGRRGRSGGAGRRARLPAGSGPSIRRGSRRDPSGRAEGVRTHEESGRGERI